MSKLFCGNDVDKIFKAVRDDIRFNDIRDKCEVLWKTFEPIADHNFPEEFSKQFLARFWEMYIGVKLLELHPEVKNGAIASSSNKPAPDFLVGNVFVEATVAERGNNIDAIPDISELSENDSVRFRECVLRLTSKVREKSKSNNLPISGQSASVVIAVNLPYPEVWICYNPPIVAQAFLGVQGLSLVKQADGSWVGTTICQKTIERSDNQEPVDATLFRDKTYEHIRAIILAVVNPFSSSYSNPGFELLHNPNALHPLPRGWLRLGNEYWVEGGKLLCHNHDRM